MTKNDWEWLKNTKNYISQDDHVQQYLFFFLKKKLNQVHVFKVIFGIY